MATDLAAMAPDRCMKMTLTPMDMLKIQSAIARYEKRFPRKSSPSASEALAWADGKGEREWLVYTRRAWARTLDRCVMWWRKFGSQSSRERP